MADTTDNTQSTPASTPDPAPAKSSSKKAATDDLSSYVVKTPVKHDRKDYKVGDLIRLADGQAVKLIDKNIISKG